MEQEKLKFLAEYVSNISPELWEITLAYIHSAAIQWVIASVGMFIIFIFFLVGFRKAETEEDRAGWAMCSAFFFVLCLAFLGSAIGRFNSPDMYAVRYLLNMVP